MTPVDDGPLSTGRRRAVLAGLGIALTACGGPRRRRPDDQEDERRFARRGYVPASAGDAQGFAETWMRGDRELLVDGLVPRTQGNVPPAPVVLHLPGLGEGPQAGIAWRRAWAAAGYAVVSLQSRDDRDQWASPLARAGEFRRAARDRFSAAALAARVQDVGFALDRLRDRAAAGAAPFAGIDPGRVAVAGFDLGSQTALGLAGERHPGLGILPRPAAVQAVIALSPIANAAAGGLAERYSGVSLPLLVVTGTDDGDPYGMVDSPFARQAPFHFVPPGNKFLLVLAGGTHATVSGTPGPGTGDAGHGGESSGAGRGPSGPPGGSFGRFGDGPGGGTGGGGGGGSGGGGSGDGGWGRGSRGAMGPGPGSGGPPPGAAAGNARQAVVVEGLSTAFLDATLRRDPVAAEWLARDASRWVGDVGHLQSR